MPSSSIIDHPSITAEERGLRLRAIDSARARASVRLEGTILPVEIETINRQCVDGELSTSEHVKRVIEAADQLRSRRPRRLLPP